MPRIPIAEIPNAPQSVPLAEIPARANQIGGMNIAGAAGMLQTPTIKQGAFDGPTEGMKALGASVQQVGMVANQLAVRTMQENNDRMVMEADRAMEDDYAAFMNEMQADPSIDPATWGDRWNKRFSTTFNTIRNNKNLSNSARQTIEERARYFGSTTSTRVQGQSSRSILQRTSSEHEARAERFKAMGDTESQIREYEVMRDKGYLYPEQFEGLKHNALYNQQLSQVTSLITVDPKTAKTAIDSPEYDLIPDAMRVKLREQADRAEGQYELSLYGELSDMIDAGTLTDSSAVDDMNARGYLKPHRVKVLKAKIDSIPKDDAALYNATHSLIEDYDSDADSKQQQLIEIRTQIDRLPKQQAKVLTENLADRMNKDPQKVSGSARQQAYGRITKARKAGLLGEGDEFGKGEEAEAERREMQMRDRVDQYFKANPEATNEEALNFVQQELAGFQEVDKGPRWWNPFSWGRKDSSETPPSEPAPVMKQIDDILEREKPKGKPLGKVTDYGQPDDPYLDSNTAKKIGAWNNTLHPESLAISPDIERMFKDQGIQQDDWVVMTLADGSEVRRQWSDRTSHKLTGRFDFYSPDGIHPDREKRVIAFRKA